jgi:hypothetical protein
MSPTNDSTKTSSSQYAFNSKVLLVGGEVGCLTLIIVLASVFGGLWLDNLLGTKPLITIILVLASAPLSLVLTFWIAKRAVKDIETLPPAGAQGSSNQFTEGDTTGE